MRRTVKGGAELLIGLLAVLVNEGRVSATGDCSDNRLVQIGRLPDIIFPAGHPTCVVIPPTFFRVKAISDTSVGNCGTCVHVRNGSPHITVATEAATKQTCAMAAFGPATANEITNASGIVEQVRQYNLGFTVYSDGTPGSGTLEVMSKDGFEDHNRCLTSPGQYVIGTFNYFVTSAVVTDTAFTHVVSTANNPVPSHTVITHPLLDGEFGARPILTSVWNYGSNPGVDDNQPVGFKFGIDVNGLWSIVALDGGALPMGAQFNVEISPHSDDAQFVAPPVPAYRRSMGISSSANHDSQALLFPVWGGNVQNAASSVGSYYNAASGSWVLSNMTGAHMPDDSDFFVRTIGASGSFSSLALQVVSNSSNTVGESLFLDNSFQLNSLSRMFVSPIWAPGSGQFAPDGPEVAAPLGVWWTGNQWAIWRQDWQAIPAGAAFNVYWHRPATVGFPTRGDSNGDRYADIALTGGSGILSTIPVAMSSGDGYTFNAPTSFWDPTFSWWTQVATAVSGDFDGDGRTDIALTAGPGWATIPVAFSMGDGAFRITNDGVTVDDGGHTNAPHTLPLLHSTTNGDANFPSYAAQAGARPVGGDFNGDGLADLALLTVPGLSTIPTAFSRGDGTFAGINDGVADGDTGFTGRAAEGGAKAVTGDFDGDGRSDIALTGVSGWTTVPVAFSYGNGSFHATNTAVADFPSYAASPNARVLAGDFDGDGKSDIALVGAASDIRIALSNGDGSFHVVTSGSSGGCSWLVNYQDYPSVKAFSGDFNGDGKADVGLIASYLYDCYGTCTDHQLLTALSNGDGTFTCYTTLEDGQTPGFISAAATSGATILSGSPSSPRLRNLARGMTATQMQPTAWGGDPERAVDGNPDGNWGSSSVTHTDYLDQAWWQVDLGASKFVTSVDVFNRTDCCADRLSNFYVMTSTDGSTWTANYNYFNAGNPSSFLVNSQARYVKIQLAGTNYLSLAEVYVWGP